MKIYIDKKQELTAARLTKLIRYFESAVKPDLTFLKGYYDGVGQEIMHRQYEDMTRPHNRIVKNYTKTIVDNFRGYTAGVPITYSAHDDNDITPLLEVLADNDVVNSDSEFLKNGLIYGVAYQLCYINEKSEKKFKNIDSRTGFPVYSADLDEELLYFVTYSPIVDWDSDSWEDNYAVTVYDKDNIYHYTSDSSFGNLVPQGIESHLLQQVPVAIFSLNAEEEGIFKPIISLQDAYNKLLSDEVNDFESFVDAYMVLQNVVAEAEDLAAMKESRTILIDGDSDVKYLTKDSSTSNIESLLANINQSIHTISNSPDFSSEEFNQGVSSGIALQFKLVGFNNVASNIEGQFRKALEKRIDILNAAFGLIDTNAYVVKITFNHNLPSSIADTVTMVNGLRGLVSDETLLTQLPFVTDVEKELERISTEQSALSSMYNFGE